MAGAGFKGPIAQDTYLGWMSAPEGFDYFVNHVLPDIISGKAWVVPEEGSNLGSRVPMENLLMATQANGAGLGLSIPVDVLTAAQNPPPPAATPVDIPAVPAGQITDGRQWLRDTLNSWGLGGTFDLANGLVTSGASFDQAIAEIRGTNEWKTRFSGVVERQKRGLPVSATSPEADVLAYETSMNEMLHQYGITGYGRDDYQRWYGADLSPSEMSKRASVASQWAYSAPPEARAAVNRLYGIHEGDLTHYVFDADHALPEVQRKIDAASIAGASSRVGFGQLSATQAERIGSLTNPDAAAGQLAKMAQQNALYVGLPGEGGNFTLDQVIAGYFGGDASILERLRRRNETRDFGRAGGGVAQTSKGAVGAGVVTPA